MRCGLVAQCPRLDHGGARSGVGVVGSANSETEHFLVTEALGSG